MKIFILFWFILEFVVFFVVAHWLGLFTSILLIVISMIVGANLVKSRMEAFKQMQVSMMMGQAAGNDLLGGMAFLVAGFFLMVPGFLSSIVGLVLLVPMWRNKVAVWLLRHGFMKRQAPPRQAANQPEGRTIDGEAWRDNK